MSSIESKILTQIKSLPKGELLFPTDFSKLGSSEAVRLSLFRLEKAGIITRVAREFIPVQKKVN